MECASITIIQNASMPIQVQGEDPSTNLAYTLAGEFHGNIMFRPDADQPFVYKMMNVVEARQGTFAGHKVDVNNHQKSVMKSVSKDHRVSRKKWLSGGLGGLVKKMLGHAWKHRGDIWKVVAPVAKSLLPALLM